ncbi:uncharacterized protein LOC124417942 isoform X2 [Gallus gallus]|uniref:uncharacterized protein LOC124417942 isoform X2 n=1 Tax=Gallus gallus TaxID=9031 RepID=UPI001EFF90D0|nr:uncharacterized protein LOC124417942 isoform X2 [Gallus gallus]
MRPHFLPAEPFCRFAPRLLPAFGVPERAAGAGAATERRRRAPGARHRAGRGIARRPPQKEPGGARQCPRSAVPASVGREVLPDSGRGAAAAPLRERGRLYAERDAARHGSFAGCPARSGADVTSGAWGTHFSQPPPPPPAALAGGSVSGSVARRGRPLAARRARSTLVSGVRTTLNQICGLWQGTFSIALKCMGKAGDSSCSRNNSQMTSQ